MFIRNNISKSLSIFFVIFTFGFVAATGISINHAIQLSQDNLISSIPRIATITVNPSGTSNTWTPISVENIEEIGALPQVQAFDFSFANLFYSTQYRRYINSSPHPDWGIDSSEIIDWESLVVWPAEGVEQFLAAGIANPVPIDVESGIIELIDGRFFSAEEIEEGSPVAWISKGFADINQLGVGSILSLDNIFFDTPEGDIGTLYHPDTQPPSFEEAVLAFETLLIEIIGIFDIIPDMNATTGWQTLQWTQNLLNQIYLPNRFLEQSLDFIQQKGTEFRHDFFQRQASPVANVFLLNDPRELSDFIEEANHFLPPIWHMRDLSENIQEALQILHLMEVIAEGTLIGAITAGVVSIALVLFMSLKGRRHEMGLYLALGERKFKILAQLLIEMGLISLLSLSLALGAGNIISSHVSRFMIQSDLLQQEKETEQGDFIPPELAWLNPGEVTTAELMEIYDVSLDLNTMIFFYGGSALTILIGIMLPVGATLRTNPKKILM